MNLRIKSFFRAALAMFFFILAPAKAPAADSVPDVRSLSIYQIMVAPYLHAPDGAPGYKAIWGPEGHRTDGNLRGVISALDHIKDLGMNAVWLTPVFDSTGGLGGEKLQGTGYFATDYFDIDPKFGTKEDFRELVEEAHKRGLYVILDGVFGHHGGVSRPSPQGHRIRTVEGAPNGRPNPGEWGNVSFPASLDYFKDVISYWMEEFGVDGWRLDQSYQVNQEGHNYWHDLRLHTERVAADRRARGEQWGTLGYMVGEDWGDPSVITSTLGDGLRSVFDFQGRNAILKDVAEGVELVARPPYARGYEMFVTPNLFASNHDMDRVADVVPDSLVTAVHAAVASYSGPVTLYYNEEWADRSGQGQPDNRSRTSGRLLPANDRERHVHEYVRSLYNIRASCPAMWRGVPTVTRSGAATLLHKEDPVSGQRILIVFGPEGEKVKLPAPARDLVTGKSHKKSVVLGPDPAILEIK